MTSPRSRFRKINTVDLVTISLAREALLHDVGDRLQTVDAYVDAFDVSRGTVQKAIATLERSGAVTIEKRGVLGSFLAAKNQSILWYEADWSNLAGAGGLPRTKRQEALAASVYTAFEDAQVPFSLAYLQGALTRVKGLLTNQYDFVLASKSAAKLLLPEYGDQINIALELAPFSYLSGYMIVTRQGESVKDAKLIGIDSNSPDHVYVAKRVFGDLVERGEASMIDLHFTKMPTALAAGDLDSFIFNRDVVDFSFEGPPLELHDIPIELDFSDLTCAVILTSDSNYMIDDLLRKLLHPESLALIQQEVLEGKRYPIL